MKKTLCFTKPAYLKLHRKQLVVEFPDNNQESHSIPLEDIAYILLENPQITLTHACLQNILAHQIALISCDERHLPAAQFLAYDSHSEYHLRLYLQINCSPKLKAILWQSTVQAKINNQAAVLKSQNIAAQRLVYLANKVKPNDANNTEAQAANFYWKQLFGDSFLRGRFEEAPNHLLNYAYAILRAIIARAIAITGLSPALGIFHSNKYNAYCLADDLMEPFRPFVDQLVLHIIQQLDGEIPENLDPEIKKKLLKLPQIDCLWENKMYPLQIAARHSVVSYFNSLQSNSLQLQFPKIVPSSS